MEDVVARVQSSRGKKDLQNAAYRGSSATEQRQRITTATARRATHREALTEDQADSLRHSDSSASAHARSLLSEAQKLQSKTNNDQRSDLRNANASSLQTQLQLTIAETDMDPRASLPGPVPCAVCAQSTHRAKINPCGPLDFDLRLLRNDFIPVKCVPKSYNLRAYDGAILYAPALHVKERLGTIDVCTSCRTALKNKQPVNTIVNFQYHGRDVTTLKPGNVLLNNLLPENRQPIHMLVITGGENEHPDQRRNQGCLEGYCMVHRVRNYH
ncbi:hypothetical protein C8J57DRAFT_1258810 [Mycena rebaudengoi]|nr:hypothetical protein C8J57DRAFT_1258810 [Mycena rebaudengoi]